MCSHQGLISYNEPFKKKVVKSLKALGRKSSRSLWTEKLSGKPNGALLTAEPQASCVQSIRKFSGTILGVDPSLRGTGLALLHFTKPDEAQLLHSETVSLHRKFSMHQCLGKIAKAVDTILNEHRIDCLVIEQTIYVQNFQTAQILGAARGAAIAPAAMRELDVYEYAPLRIKQAVVGVGRASKEQVMGMTKSLLNLDVALASDEADAAAAAFCHALTWKQ